MDNKISKELSEQIEREAEAYATNEWKVDPSVKTNNTNALIHWQNSKEDHLAGSAPWAALLQDSERRRNEANALLSPLLDYGQSNEANIPLGKSITAVILDRAKKAQQMAEALERVQAMRRVDPVAFKFPGYTEQESKAAAVGYNQALEDTWAIIDFYASKALASWKEEGKEGKSNE